jgi:hypothetical protein
VKYWEVIADNLSKAGWTRGCVSGVDSRVRMKSLTAFVEPESAVRAVTFAEESQQEFDSFTRLNA